MPNSTPPRDFSPQIQAVIAEILPFCREIAAGQRYAVSVGGSLGKGNWDARSDIDFRLYTDRPLPGAAEKPELWEGISACEARWKARGVLIDGVWPRTTVEIEAEIERWFAGHTTPIPMFWTILGYYLLPDMYHQVILEDPYHIIGGWKERLAVYPPRLKQAILAKTTFSLRYWRGDYHYASKVARGDIVFTAGMASKLVHEVLQVLFALNETYYVGDGSNLDFAGNFALRPPDLVAQVQNILYPQPPDPLEKQYADVCRLIDEILILTETKR